MAEDEKPIKNSGTGLIIMTILSLPVWLLNSILAVRFGPRGFQFPLTYSGIVSAGYIRGTLWVSVIVSVFTPIFLFLSWIFWNREKRKLKILFLILQSLLFCIAVISLLAFILGLLLIQFSWGINAL